jgi:hypothetical protein
MCRNIQAIEEKRQVTQNSQRYLFVIGMHGMKHTAASEVCFASPVEVSVIRL